MKRVNKILTHEAFCRYLKENEAEEVNRSFCPHQFEHLLAVARLTYLLLLEEGSPFISREMAYAAGLLHDIGRFKQYRENIDHAEAGAKLAAPILSDTGFSAAESNLIMRAIAQHRSDDTGQQIHRSPLSRALQQADRLSRLCFHCAVQKQCNKIESQPHREELIY